MTVKITYFVHGTTEDNENDVASGWARTDLSKLGLKQAKELGDLVADEDFAVIFCSDQRRAVKSAKLGFGEQYRIIEDERLRECNYGIYNQRPAAEFKEGRLLDHVERPYPEGECYRDVEERMEDFLKDLKQEYDGQHVAIMAHHAPQLALEVLTKGKSWEQAIEEDWRKDGEWQPGWDYVVE